MKTQFNQKYLCSVTGEILEEVNTIPDYSWDGKYGFQHQECKCHNKDVMLPYSVIDHEKHDQERRKSLGLEVSI